MSATSARTVGWEADRGLQARMIAGLVLLVAFPFAFVLTLEWALSTIVPAVTAAVTGVHLDLALAIDRRLLAAVVLGGLIVQYSHGDRLALRSLGARPVDPADRPALQATVDRLAQQADLPPPDLAVIDTEAPNAFATGRSQSAASIVVTTGLLERLDDAELEAVLAHEIAHVKNRDASVMTVAYLLPTLTYLVATSAYAILRTVFHSFRYLRTSHDNDGRAMAAVIVVIVTTTIVTIAVSALFWLGSFLLYRLLCRYREHAADRGAARLTGDPSALASALATIEDDLAETPDRDLRDLDGGVEALYVAPLEFAQFTEDGDDGLLSKDLFPETHPDTADRIERLRAMQADRDAVRA